MMTTRNPLFKNSNLQKICKSNKDLEHLCTKLVSSSNDTSTNSSRMAIAKEIIKYILKILVKDFENILYPIVHFSSVAQVSSQQPFSIRNVKRSKFYELHTPYIIKEGFDAESTLKYSKLTYTIRDNSWYFALQDPPFGKFEYAE